MEDKKNELDVKVPACRKTKLIQKRKNPLELNDNWGREHTEIKPSTNGSLIFQYFGYHQKKIKFWNFCSKDNSTVTFYVLPDRFLPFVYFFLRIKCGPPSRREIYVGADERNKRLQNICLSHSPENKSLISRF
ncbi:hypothetical protein LOAG_12178 [Loa loa]|uniref:Uncharacterized protein n=1 Tax=Loa loa TaxID=7209 RepID=A0A1S0TLS5_LOALO|nr:hypothetical protein LOAG_12178 [Loa loa]EFO16329.1 hypothetical protein LOAG_12178 [Loa loa]